MILVVISAILTSASASRRPDLQVLRLRALRPPRRAATSAAGGKGGQTQAIGRLRGGRTTKIRALTDRYCRPIAFLLTGGNVADCTAGHDLLKQLTNARILHADKGYDSNAIRRQVEANGTMPNIPPRVNQWWKSTFSRVLYRNRNAIERMFCRLKGFRCVATRYDRLAVNFLAAVHGVEGRGGKS